MNARARFDHDTTMVAVLIVAIALGAVLAAPERGWWAALYLGQIAVCAAALAIKLRRLLRGPRLTIIERRNDSSSSIKEGK